MRKKRWGGSTDRVDQVETEEIANPVNGGDDGDRLLREIEDPLSEPFGLVCGVPGSHDGEEREAEEVGVGRGSLGYIGCRGWRCWAGMSNRKRRRSLYVRPGDDVVIVGIRREKGFTKFPLDWPKASIRPETRGNGRERRDWGRPRAVEEVAQKDLGGYGLMDCWGKQLFRGLRACAAD